MAGPWEKYGRPQGLIVSDPYKARSADREDRQLGLSAAQVGISGGNLAVSQANAQRERERQAALLPYDAQKAQAEAIIAQQRAQAAAKEQALAPKPETALIQSALQTDNVIGLLNTARQQIGQGYSTGNVMGSKAFQHLPFVGQKATNLAGTLNGISGNVINDTLKQLKAASASGASGMGALSDKEGDRLAAAVASLSQEQDEPTLLRNLSLVETHYRNALALLNNEDPRIPGVQAKYGIIGSAPEEKKAVSVTGNGPIIPNAPAQGGLTADGQFQPDPGLSGVNATVAQQIRAGKTAPEIKDYLNRVSPGLGDRAQNLDAWVQFGRQHPDKGVQVDLEKQWVPAGGASQAMGNAALWQDPFSGASPGAALIGATDLLSGGTLDNMTGNPDMARAVMSGVQQRNPGSYGTGQVAGGVALGLGGEAGLARAGLTGAARGVTADMLMGGAYGAGSADEPGQSRVSGALLGAAAGAAGNVAGRGVARVAGRLGAGVQDGARTMLDAAGVRMTPGQILGGVAQRTEDRLAGLPLVGDMIRARRMEGYQDFNRAAMGEAMAPIGGAAPADIGFQGVQANQGTVSQAYRDALGGVSVPADQQFGSDLGAAVSQIDAIPRVGPEVSDSVGGIMSDPAYYPGGVLPGENMQAIMQELRGLRSGYAQDPLGHRVGEGVRSVEDSLSDLVERQSPGTMDAYRSADAAYRGQSIIDDAVLKGQNQGGVFTPAQLGQSMKANVKAYGGKRAAARGEMPFQQLQQAGQEVLPSSVPDSGTAGRLALPALVGALAGGGNYAANGEEAGSSLGTGVAAALLAAAPYSAPARNLLQRALIGNRPQVVQRAGQSLLDNSSVAGLLAAPGLIDYTAGQ